MIIYDIQNVTLTYPKQNKPANNNITFQINEGEIFGLLGDNGAGKTTLVKQMMNLYRPTTGAIMLKGKAITSDPLHAPMNVGYMPQKANALNNLTVGEALYFAAHLRGLSRAAPAVSETCSWKLGTSANCAINIARGYRAVRVAYCVWP